jgi:hypothetical protein
MDNSESLEIQDQSQVIDPTQDQDQESEEELLPQNKFPALDPTRSGFIPVIDLDIVVDPGINLLSQFVDQHREDSRSNRKMLFESFYSLFCVLALEALNETHSKTSSFEACQLIALEYNKICKTFHLGHYHQQTILCFFQGVQLPMLILSQLTSIGKDSKGKLIALHKKYKKMSEKLENVDKMDNIITANLGEKVLLYYNIYLYII